MKVNIYILTNIRGPRVCSGRGMYLMESIIDGRPYTVNEILELEKTTNNELTLMLLIKALERMRKNAEISIFTECEHVSTAAEKWVKQWEENGWKNKKGKYVKNIDLWQQFLELVKPHNYSMSQEKNHSYSQWMRAELKK